jgi:adenine-specific DNA-methyltransferase
VYSADRCANTVGHYEAYLKKGFRKAFKFDLVRHTNTPAQVYRLDANELVKTVRSDVAYVDPPYNSRQYSRFYHVLETLVKWDKPVLSGVALKPPIENTSRYCKVDAPDALADLVENLDARFIVISYNNTYKSKSSSSRNKIELDEIAEIANGKGSVRILEQHHKHFNAGKTDFKDHAEYLFLIETGKLD